MNIEQNDPFILNKVYERLEQLSVIWNNLCTGGNINRSTLNQLEDTIAGLTSYIHQHKDNV